MRVRVLAERIREFNNITSSITYRHSLPILYNIKLHTKEGHLYGTITDLEKALIFDLGGKVEEEGETIIDRRQLARFASYEHGAITIASDPDKKFVSLISRGDGQSILRSYQNGVVKDYPPIPTLEVPLHNIHTDFITNIGRACPFSASDESRPVLRAIYLGSNGDGQLKFAAADGFRLYSSSMEANLPVGEWLLPRDTARLLVRAAVKREHIQIGFDEDKKVTKINIEPDITVISQLIQASFPRYLQLIPQGEPTWKATVSAPLFQQRLQQFDIAALGSGIVRLSPDSYFLRISMGSEEIGDYWSRIPAKMEGEGKIACNQKFIVEIVKLFSEMTMEMTNPSSPIRITGDLKNVVVVLMPMFVQFPSIESEDVFKDVEQPVPAEVK